MTAAEARKLSESVGSSKAANQLAIIEKRIAVAAENGIRSIAPSEPLMPQVRKELEKRGFVVKDNHDPRGESWTTISW